MCLFVYSAHHLENIQKGYAKEAHAPRLLWESGRLPEERVDGSEQAQVAQDGSGVLSCPSGDAALFS